MWSDKSLGKMRHWSTHWQLVCIRGLYLYVLMGLEAYSLLGSDSVKSKFEFMIVVLPGGATKAVRNYRTGRLLFSIRAKLDLTSFCWTKIKRNSMAMISHYYHCIQRTFYFSIKNSYDILSLETYSLVYKLYCTEVIL